MKAILSTVTLVVLLAFGSGGNVWAGETLQMMKVAGNPCAAKHTNPCNPCNPCAKKAANPCNPCAKKAGNPCNPCGKKVANPCNPCAKKAANPCNPCAKISSNPCNPCGKKSANPCNPCGGKAASADDRIDPKLVSRPAGLKLYSGLSRAALVKEGGKLFKDMSLSSNNLSCNDCHSTNALFNKGFAKPYPHNVSMAKERAGLSRKLHADEFVQFCMMAPMAADPLPWKGQKLAALSAYVVDIKQKEYSSWLAANPCASKAAVANPCAVNPCAARNPCAAKNPCAVKNPCGMKKS